MLTVLLVSAVSSAGRRVDVTVRRRLGAPPEAARSGWLDYTWSSGGGLPGVLVLPRDSEAWPRGEPPHSRLVLPLAIEEALEDTEAIGAEVRYRVTDDGLLSAEMVAGSHAATVAFVPEAGGGAGCELVWKCEFEVRHRQRLWQAVTETLIGQSADNLAARLLEPSRPTWFCPLRAFGGKEEAFGGAGEFAMAGGPATRAQLLVLPGLDGSAVTAWMQYPELGLEYDVRALAIPPTDRSGWEDLVGLVVEEVVRSSDGGARKVFLLGESMGAGLALEVGRRCAGSSLSGLVLVSPATGWDRTWLGGARDWLLALPEPALALVVALTSYQLLDAGQIGTTLVRIATGRRSPLLASRAREDYAWRVVRELPSRLASPGATIRHRLARWVEPSLALGRADALAPLTAPILLIAGTADRRVPAAEEAERIARAAPARCRPTVRLVRGAGHAGVTDDRLDLRHEMAVWRGEGKGERGGEGSEGDGAGGGGGRDAAARAVVRCALTRGVTGPAVLAALEELEELETSAAAAVAAESSGVAAVGVAATPADLGGTWELVFSSAAAKLPFVDGYMPNRELLEWDVSCGQLRLTIETLPFLPPVRVTGEALQWDGAAQTLRYTVGQKPRSEWRLLLLDREYGVIAARSSVTGLNIIRRL